MPVVDELLLQVEMAGTVEAAAAASQIDKAVAATGTTAAKTTQQAGQGMKNLAENFRLIGLAIQEEQKQLRKLEVEAARAGIAQKRLAEASAAGASGLRGVSDATKAAGRQLGGSVNIVTEMAYGFAGLNPKIREFTINLAGAGNNAVQLGGSFGPIGVGVALLIGLLPTLISLVGDSGDEAEEAAGEFTEYATTISQAASSIRDFIRAGEESRRVSAGQGGIFETEARLLEITRERSRLEEDIAAVRRGAASADVAESSIRALGLDQKLRELEDEAEVLATVQSFRGSSLGQAAVEGEADAGGTTNRGGRRRERNTEAQEFARRRAARERLEERLAELDRKYREEEVGRELRARDERLRAAHQEADDLVRIAEQQARDAEQLQDDLDEAAERDRLRQRELVLVADEAAAEYHKAWRDGIDAVIDAYAELEDASRMAGQEFSDSSGLMAQVARAAADDIADAFGNTALSAFEASVDAFVEGEATAGEALEAFAKNAVTALVKESIVQAVVEGARALADLASLNPVGAAAHAAAAAAWTGVAAAAASVGLATGGVGSVSPGGPSSAGGGAPPPLADQERDRASRDRGPSAIYITLNAPNAVGMTRADSGVFVDQLLAAARREGLIQ